MKDFYGQEGAGGGVPSTEWGCPARSPSLGCQQPPVRQMASGVPPRSFQVGCLRSQPWERRPL